MKCVKLTETVSLATNIGANNGMLSHYEDKWDIESYNILVSDNKTYQTRVSKINSIHS